MDTITKHGHDSIFFEERCYNGTVVVGDATDHGWTFVNLGSPKAHGGPVAGNREFGYVMDGTSAVFYTRGAHRLAGPLFLNYGPIHFKWADSYLRSMMAALMLYVNNSGGTAAVEPRITADYGWAKTQSRYYHPTVEWLP